MLMVMVAGYARAGALGAVLAVVGMFLPTSLLTFAVARSWERLRDNPWRRALQNGLTPVSLGLLLAGSYTLARASVNGVVTALIAAVATVVVARLRVSPALVIAVAAVVGAAFLR